MLSNLALKDSVMPYSASVIAYAFVKKGMEEGLFVTQMKLQKMVYFAHGYHLAQYGEPLVTEEFEAWKFGPVVQAIYGEYKAFGISPIKLEHNARLDRELQKLSESAKEAVEYTWKATKSLSAVALSSWTHKKDSPWASVYTPNQWNVPINNSEIKNYFTQFLSNNGSNGERRVS